MESRNNTNSVTIDMAAMLQMRLVRLPEPRADSSCLVEREPVPPVEPVSPRLLLRQQLTRNEGGWRNPMVQSKRNQTMRMRSDLVATEEEGR